MTCARRVPRYLSGDGILDLAATLAHESAVPSLLKRINRLPPTTAARKAPRCPQKPRKPRGLMSVRGTFTAPACEPVEWGPSLTNGSIRCIPSGRFRASEEHQVTPKPSKSRGPGALARVWLWICVSNHHCIHSSPVILPPATAFPALTVYTQCPKRVLK
jgi:hypothetical protein